MSNKSVGITGTGRALGSELIANAQLASRLNVTDAWIQERVGIRERRRAAADEFPSTLGARAARLALESAHLKGEDLDAIICGTVTPDYSQMPSTACLIQAELGARSIPAFDLAGACSGFVYCLEMAQKLIWSGSYKNILVICVDFMTRFTDYNDPKTSVLFADGAGAVIVSATEHGSGILATDLGADGTMADCLLTPAGGARLPPSCETVREGLHFMKMRGRELFKAALAKMSQSAACVLEKLNLEVGDLDLVIPHQANQRIIDALGSRLEISPAKVFSNIQMIGNTGSASIPIALDECVRSNLVKPGDLILTMAFGGGITWGSALMRW